MTTILEDLKTTKDFLENGQIYNAKNALSKLIDVYSRASSDIINKGGQPDVEGEEPERESKKYILPEIVEVDIKVQTHGNYRTPSGNAKGLVVHYTAGRRSRGQKDAIATLRYLASQGLGCLVMDKDGVIYKAKNQNIFTDVAWHAGSSSWKGVSGISRYCMGMEICCAGLLNEDYTSWFGKLYSNNIREVKDTYNVKEGKYLQFTEEQEISLVNFCLWQADVNNEFLIDWVVGHDEISPGRKFDPGGSLSMSMPEFRRLLLNNKIKITIKQK